MRKEEGAVVGARCCCLACWLFFKLKHKEKEAL